MDSRKMSGALRIAGRALQKGLCCSDKVSLLLPWKKPEYQPDGSEVKKGHFVVLASRDDKPKRFVVSLSCLSHPTFLQLLELAEEEFGFSHQGALAIPCRSSDLERILKEI